MNRFISAFKRSSKLMLIVSTLFSAFTYFAIYVILIISFVSPQLLEEITYSTSTVFPENLPEPYTLDFFLFIFANNVGYYWNPMKLLIWIPLFGTLILGLSFLLNGAVIGIVAVLSGLRYGPLFPLAGLVPHGAVEIPAFIIQWTAILKWHILVVNLFSDLVRGRIIDGKTLKQDLTDVVILSVTSILLLGVAALIETYVTPYLISLVKNGGVEGKLL